MLLKKNQILKYRDLYRKTENKTPISDLDLHLSFVLEYPSEEGLPVTESESTEDEVA